MLLITLGFLIFIGVLVYDLKTDLTLWREEKPIDHKRGVILRLLGLIPAIILIGWPSCVFVGFLYWFLFDGYFNTERGFDWWFTGSDDKDDARSDDFLQRISLTQHKLVKIGGIILGLIVYIGYLNFLKAPIYLGALLIF